MSIGFYYDLGPKYDNSTVELHGRWQWRFENSSGGERTKEEAIKSLKLCGATVFEDVTREGKGNEFGQQETT